MQHDNMDRRNGERPQVSKESARRAVREGLEILRRGRWIISIFVIAAVLGAFVHVVYWMPEPTYTAQTLLLVETNEQTKDEKPLNTGYIDGSLLGSSNLANQILILQQSQFIATRTAKRLMELHASGDAPPLPILRTDEGRRSTTELAHLIHADLIEVSRATEETDAAWIKATSTNPREAAFLADIYAEEYVARTQEMSRQRISGSREFLQNQVKSRHAELKALEDSIKQMTQEGAVALDAETERTIRQISELEALLDETRVEEQMRRASLASIQKEMADLQPRLASRIASGSDQEIDLVQKKLARLELLAQQARMRTGPVAPADQREREELDTQIQQLRTHLDSLSERYVTELLATRGIDPREDGREYIAELHRKSIEERIALSGIVAKGTALEERLRNYKRKLDAIPEQAMRLAQTRRSQRATEELYNQLVQRLQEVQIAEESEIGTARVLRSAIVPEAPNGIGRRTILVLGLFLGFLLGGIGAVIRYKLDVRIHTPEDLLNRDASLISAIPAFSTPLLPKNGQDETRMVPKDLPGASSLPVLLSPFLAEAEAFRRLYVNLQFARPDADLQTVLVTSAEKGAGKTTTATNLAIAAAQSGQRTLIIDADLRRPAVHTLLGSTKGPGLEELLLESSNLEAVTSSSYQTSVENVWAITSKEPAKDPNRLLRSSRMRDLLTVLRRHFDFIVLDTPPVLVASETMALAPQSDASIIVASAGTTAGDALDQSASTLRSVGAPLAGVVLNRFDPTYVYGYGSTYKYSYSGYEYDSA